MYKNQNSPLGHKDNKTAALLNTWQQEAADARKKLLSTDLAFFQQLGAKQKYDYLEALLLGISLFPEEASLQKLTELGVPSSVTRFFQPVEPFVREIEGLKSQGLLKCDPQGILVMVRPSLHYFWSHALRRSLGVVSLNNELPEPLDDYAVLLSLYRTREKTGRFPVPKNEFEADRIGDIQALEKRYGNKQQVRAELLLLVGEQDKLFWSQIVVACQLKGSGAAIYQPLLPLYRLLNPHLDTVDEAAFVALCEGAAERFKELYD